MFIDIDLECWNTVISSVEIEYSAHNNYFQDKILLYSKN